MTKPGATVLVEKRIAVIADPYVASFYRMIGALSFKARSTEEARRLLLELLSREDVGVVFVAAEYYEGLGEETLGIVQRKRPDLIVAALPTPRERGKPMDVQKELLKALGMG